MINVIGQSQYVPTQSLPNFGGNGVHIDTWIQDFTYSFREVLVNLVNSLHEGVTGLYEFSNSIDHVTENINLLVIGNRISANGSDFILLDNYIGNIRYACGDVVFTEIYSLLMIGLGFFMFQVLTKVIEGITYIVRTIKNSPEILNPLGSVGSFIKNLFI